MPSHEVEGTDPETGKTIRVTMDRGRIARIQTIPGVTDCYLSPGFVDLQVNGFAGYDVNSDAVTIETVAGMARELVRQGTTCFVPTVITASEEKICHALAVISQARKQTPELAHVIPCAHVEGPSISPMDGYRGAHDAAHVRPPSVSEFERWQKAGDGVVGMVTLSPHYPETAAYIAHLRNRGVHVALGHTHAERDQIRLAVEAGASLCTHLGNGLAEMISRHRNVLWSTLADDRLSVSVIADGHHLPQDLLRVIVKCKGFDRVLLVSDAVALARAAPGVYRVAVGGTVELRNDGRLCVAGTELLAGSTATMAECVTGMMRLTGLSLGTALRMATCQPGEFVGRRGRMEVGAHADLLRFRLSHGIELQDVWLRGERVYALVA